ncbi:STAS/SEC14 domain-containing protein [Sulfitobacter albidus]|uniref:STAS/SEC14 domain-containing protein n=1 Tax=Sulfitobacter albidus TaxID=2829501 RepID=A0A975JDA9_9RHOB|nr:STAS/SEC14 domain-containing protein [Sulfitobacter albidus]QUJ76343.1 STAS/SEC14 domain-containing protein [Sulfitobacter albidus]
MFTCPSIIQIPTTRDDLFAFRITAEVSREDMAGMADHMNGIFDSHEGKVDMLMIFDRYEGAETGASLSWESVKSRFRSVSNVGRYIVVGAPERAERMIEIMDHLIPVEAETFDTEEAAWRELGAEAVAK